MNITTNESRSNLLNHNKIKDNTSVTVRKDQPFLPKSLHFPLKSHISDNKTGDTNHSNNKQNIHITPRINTVNNSDVHEFEQNKSNFIGSYIFLKSFKSNEPNNNNNTRNINENIETNPECINRIINNTDVLNNIKRKNIDNSYKISSFNASDLKNKLVLSSIERLKNTSPNEIIYFVPPPNNHQNSQVLNNIPINPTIHSSTVSSIHPQIHRTTNLTIIPTTSLNSTYQYTLNATHQFHIPTATLTNNPHFQIITHQNIKNQINPFTQSDPQITYSPTKTTLEKCIISQKTPSSTTTITPTKTTTKTTTKTAISPANNNDVVDQLLPMTKLFSYTWFNLQACKRKHYKTHDRAMSCEQEHSVRRVFEVLKYN